MAFISPGPYFYDNEIDRMLAEMRVRRQQQRHMSRQRQNPADNRRRKISVTPADLFTSLLERQQSTEAAWRCACYLPKTSLLKVTKEGEPVPPHHFTACTNPRLQEKAEIRDDTSTDVSNDESLTKCLRRELCLARNENALLRRDMYRTLTTIGNYLAQFDGKGRVGPALYMDSGETGNTAGHEDHDSPLPPATSVWELCDRGVLRLSSEDAALVRDLNVIIATSLERYVGPEKSFKQGHHVLQLEKGQCCDEAAVQEH
ncbi:hypothetical protein TraAM80_00612 [Trypanosoma rangeli]|uniref:Uncharacterized protein n=1 Tax=Trypanosoma rangeli TaxID=5698 RepID=A0A422P2G8_TRYRA|nr:uncharacterized protein TraAM80_00612 [Trypanosoma rangeli]RNF11917.1 hypothetical protein TraAM80_00612 [Trypanosoma rangeli]|eukprot:RNF11917.1 hypothetical protein TraAM80_00612 [Trypanosoma rangeli]